MNSTWQDFRYSVRTLLKKPGLTLIVILTLALGVGANTAIFSLTDKLLLRSLPVKAPQQLFFINSVSISPYFVSNAFSYPDFNDYRSRNPLLTGLLSFSKTELEMNTRDRIERVQAEYTSGNYFDVLGVAAARGRTFSAEEDKTPYPVVVISQAFTQKHFSQYQDPIGQTITLNNVPLTIVGVAPKDFAGPVLERPTEVWVPVLMHSQLEQSNVIDKRQDRWLVMMGRVNEGVSESVAEAAFDLVAQQVKEANTPAGTITKGLPFAEQHIKFEPAGKGISILRKRFSSPLKALMAVVGLVLLIACANVAGLLLARGVNRRKEIAIRLALGASRWRVARHLFTESLVLALAGGIAGLILAPWLVSLLVKTQSRLNVASTLLGGVLDVRVLAFASLTTLCTAILFGVIPAWQSAQRGLIPVLKEEGNISNQHERRFGLQNLLVVGQLALAIVVLIGAGLSIKSLRNLLAIDPGYQTEKLLVIPVELDNKKYDEERGSALQKQLLQRLPGLPGVEAISYGTVLPLSGSRYMSSLFVEGRQPLPDEQMAFDANTVGPRYHETMGIRIVAGRGFTEQDRKGSPGVVIINEAMARRLFPGENALGKRVSQQTGGPSLEIVGITADVKHHDLTEEPLPHFDLPALQRGYDAYTNVVLRVRDNPANLISAARAELVGLDPTLLVDEIRPLSVQIDYALAATRLASTLIAIFGLVAMLLASIGLYGVIAWMVNRRTRELGIRIALGAQGGHVIRLILLRGFLLTIAGLALGLLVAFASTRLLASQLYGVETTDTFTFATVSILLTAVSMLACYLPARRATKVDPVEALRCE